MLNPYTKAILAGVIAFLTSLATGWDDSHLSTSEIVTSIGIGIAAIMAVWAAPLNVKWIVSGVMAGLAALAIALGDDAVSLQEWITIITATLTALYVPYQISNSLASNAPAVELPKKTPVVDQSRM
jgi:hypothetical protein